MTDRQDTIGRVSRRTALKYATAALAASYLTGAPFEVQAGTAAMNGIKVDNILPPLPVDSAKSAIKMKALPFDAADVRLLPSPFFDAQIRDAQWLLSLQPDRLLSKYLGNAGLTPKGQSYGGWEDTNIAGHIAGHYLSACAGMYRATGIVEFNSRVDYMVSELAHCQANTSDGLITGMPNSKRIFTQIATTGRVPPWSIAWAPWYNMHKLYAGLRDSYRLCGNTQARVVFLKLCDWALQETSGLNDEQIATMLGDEHGGMAEIAADAYGMTADPKYLTLLHSFTHHAIMDPLANGRDILDGQHSNTNVPKFVGYQRAYQLTGQEPFHTSAQFFWDNVVTKRTYSTGGHGDQEHFFPVTEFARHFDSDQNTETCCTYNMLKLTDALFEQNPSSSFADFTERASINHILATQEPDYGMVCYFTPFKPGHFRTYSGPENAMWCCTGTGMENHSRYGLSIYFQTPDSQTLYVNQYIASTLDWKDAGVKLRLDSALPEAGKVKLQFAVTHPAAKVIKLRKPFWGDGMTVKVNGKTITASAGDDGYIAIARTWKNGDAIDINLPLRIRLESTLNAPHKAAILYGPVLLASPMGTDGVDDSLSEQFRVQFATLPSGAKLPDILDGWTEAAYERAPAIVAPTLVGDATTMPDNIHAVPGKSLAFKTVGLGDPANVTLIPFYRLHHQRYNVYWNVYTADEWKATKEATTADRAKDNALDARTTDVFLPGGQQSEIDHQLKSANSNSGTYQGKPYRDANGGWFSFVMKVDPSAPLQIMCTYWGGDAGRTFDILIDDTKIATQQLDNLSPGQFADVLYDIPAALVTGKGTVTVTFRATPGSWAGGLFGCRILKKEKG